MAGKPKILLVDDSIDDIELTQAVLGGDADCEAVYNAEDALDFLYRRGAYANRSAGAPSLVLLDIKMPGVDGLELLGMIKSDERLKFIPVVMLTSSGEERDIAASYRLGSNAYVVKPIEAEELASVLKKTEAFWLTVNKPPQSLTGSPSRPNGGSNSPH